MENCLKTVNNCLDIFTSCIPKDTNNSDDAVNNPNNNTQPDNPSAPTMSKFFTLHLPKQPRNDDEIRIKAKLRPRPREFIINLCVNSQQAPDGDEPAMIAFHFKTTFTAHESGRSIVVLNWKRGSNDWGKEEIHDNNWIDDDVEEVDVTLQFDRHEILFLAGGSLEHQFKHRYEKEYIDRLQIGGDVEHIEEVSLRYAKK